MTTAADWARFAVGRLAITEPTVEASDDLPLAPFQQAAASRLASMIRAWGGALLADAVGLGKTRVALTVAATIAREQRIAGVRGAIWCCTPARLVEQWRQAATAAGIADDAVHFVSHTRLSRGEPPTVAPSMIVVDEAHRFRNRNTKRRDTLLTHADCPILLVTATPVANSIWDLFHLFDLWMEDADVRRRFGWDLRTAFELAEQGRFDITELVLETTVRRLEPPATQGFGLRPATRLHLEHYVPSEEESWVWNNLEPTLARLSLAAVGEEWPRGLFVEHVLRRWESGPEALVETVGELVAYHERWLEAWRSGATLDRQTFRTMFGSDVARQQVFGFVYPTGPTSPTDDAAVRRDLEILAGLEERIRRVVETGSGRDDVVVRLARASGDRLLVFTNYRRAARALFERLGVALGPTARIGLLTGDAARATGLGRVSDVEVIRRFAPAANRAGPLETHQQLRILVATDCIAEGTNLQDCGRVVLADLPYTPLGIEQRVGRLVRPGGPHEVVHVYLPRPRDWNDSLGMRRRLNTKLTAAHDAGVGHDRDWFDAPNDSNPLDALTALDRLAASTDPATRPDSLCGTLVEEPSEWLVVAEVEDDGATRDWWFLFIDGEVRHDMRAFVARLADLVWDERTLSPTELPPALPEAIAARERFLRAAHGAPAALGLDAPEVHAWRRICAEADIPPAAFEDLRPRLLRRHSAAVRRRLAALSESAPIDRLVRYVTDLQNPRADDVTIRLIGALGLA